MKNPLRIPQNRLNAARRAGLRYPHGYVGVQDRPPGPRKHTLESIIASVDAERSPKTDKDIHDG
jgi:hypothetical protein